MGSTLLNQNENRLNTTKIAVAGAASGGLTRATLQPFDVLKIRFQLQSSGQKYTSITQAVFKIFREESIKAFWKGHIPAQALSITYGIFQFGTWEEAHKLSEHYKEKWFSPILVFGAGACGGLVATTITFPFDVLRTRLIAQSRGEFTYSSLLKALQIIPKTEGYLAFYKGLYPALIQIVPYSGTQYLCYKIFSKIYNTSNSVNSAMVCGSLSGFCGKLVVYPLDLCKKRLQIQGMQQWIFADLGFKCRGLTHCLILTVQNEGFLGLYKGFLISAIKACLVSGVTFTIFETTCLLLKTN